VIEVVYVNGYKPTTTSANALLASDKYKKLVIEVVYVNGYKPTTTTLNNLKTFLSNRLHKPDGIAVLTKEISSPGNASYSTQQIIDLETTHRTKYNSTDEIAVFALFIDGESASSSSNGQVLGTAYRNTSFVLFEEQIHGFSDSAFEPSRTVLETTVLLHEFGHILGLTNLGSPMQTPHEDSTHTKHCNDDECLMYWAVETSDGLANLVSGGSVPSLDSQCLSDLQANGGK